jgi:hypothetical protein
MELDAPPVTWIKFCAAPDREISVYEYGIGPKWLIE